MARDVAGGTATDMQRWRRAAGLVFILAALIAVGQTNVDSARPAATANELTIGALLDLRDGWTSLGRSSRVTLQVAVANANARLAKSGSKMRVRLDVVDVHGDPRASLRALRRFAAEGVGIAIGPEASSEVRAVRAAADSLGVLLISQGSTAHSLAIPGDNVFRFVPDDVRESEALVALLHRGGIDAIVPVWRADAGNAGLATSVRKRFERTGGSVAKGVRYGTQVGAFEPIVAQLHAQVASLQSHGASRVAVYLAGFDEVARLFDAASGDALLRSLPWYGSDGVALSPRLLRAKAAGFATSVGYPSPILGVDDAAARRSSGLVGRIQAKLGRRPDAFALTAYDALQVAVNAAARSGGVADTARLKRSLVGVAHGYVGVTGKLLLNAAGDRAYGSYDFWSVCKAGAAATWKRTWSYVATAPGRGRILARARCGGA